MHPLSVGHPTHISAGPPRWTRESTRVVFGDKKINLLISSRLILDIASFGRIRAPSLGHAALTSSPKPARPWVLPPRHWFVSTHANLLGALGFLSLRRNFRPTHTQRRDPLAVQTTLRGCAPITFCKLNLGRREPDDFTVRGENRT